MPQPPAAEEAQLGFGPPVEEGSEILPPVTLPAVETGQLAEADHHAGPGRARRARSQPGGSKTRRFRRSRCGG